MKWMICVRILIVDNNVGSAALREHGVRDRRFIQREALAQLHEHRIVDVLGRVEKAVRNNTRQVVI
jgi:hypothetical protein